MRTWFALRHGFNHRGALAALRDAGVDRLPDLSFSTLRAEGIQVLALDFDGVLASHGRVEVAPELHAWLREACEAFPRIYLLSNEPGPARLAWLNEHFPAIHCITGERKKPYPDGLLAIARHARVAPSVIALVDDRLLTGMLACLLAGARGIYLRQPWIHYRVSPVKEGYFQILRVLERWLAGRT